MKLAKDYEFRKLVAEYLHWIFTTGIDRVWAHEAVCDYLVDNWDIYKDSNRDRRDLQTDLHLLMGMFITNNVFDSLDWPTDERGTALRQSKYTKQLVDRFCDRMEKLKKVLKDDLDFWEDKGGEHVSRTGRYYNLDEYLNERNS